MPFDTRIAPRSFASIGEDNGSWSGNSSLDFEAAERAVTFAYATHALLCCPCGEDHSSSLLAHKLSLATATPVMTDGSEEPGFGGEIGDAVLRQALTFSGEVAAGVTTTAVMAVGDTATSQIEVLGDQDWFRITLEAGVTYQFTMNSSGGTPLSDPYLRLMNASGSELAFNDDNAGSLNSLIRFTATSSGTYYLNAGAYANSSTGTYTLGASTAPAQPVVPTYSVGEIADYLVNEGFAGGRGWAQTNISFNMEGLTAAQQLLAQRALDAWSAVTPLTFTRTTGTGNITFANVDPQNPGSTAQSAFARTSLSATNITASTIVITNNWNGGNTDLDSYTYQTYLHEVGHALGLGHGGPYNGNATYGVDNVYTNDSWAFSVMSYFDQEDASLGTFRFVLGPQQADIVAIQDLYGANPNGTNPGNTTYGFNSSAPGTVMDWSQFVTVQGGSTFRRPPAMTIFDTGGIDTINLSGFSQAQTLSLIGGTFSSLGDRPGSTELHYVNVVAIAENTLVENAVGGSGSDRIIGNSADNTITLGSGSDVYSYGAGGGNDTITDFVAGTDRLEVTGFSQAVLDAAFASRTAEGSGTRVTFASGQSVLFQGVAPTQLTAAAIAIGVNTRFGAASGDTLLGTSGVDIFYGRGGNDLLTGAEDNDQLFGEDGDDNLYGGAGADALNGGAGNDWLYGDSSDAFTGGAGYDTVRIEDVSSGGLTLSLAAAGIERVYATNNADNLNGSATTGGIVLYGFGGVDILWGGSGSDYIYAGHQTIESGNIRGSSGYDYLIHDSNSLFGGSVTINMNIMEVEGVFGSYRAETINAAGNSVFATIFTGGGADIVTGTIFNDVIFMDNETASVNAGTGFDYVVYNRFDGSGAFRFDLAAMGAEGAIGRDGNDVLDARNVTSSFVTLFGYGGADTLIGGTGNDYLYIDAADLEGGSIIGGAGYDYLINQGATAMSVTLVNHQAEGFFGSSAAETVSAAGLATFTTIFSGGGADTITGSGFNDAIFITNSFSSVNAGAGYDYLVYELFDGTGATNWNLAAMGAEGAIGRNGNDTFNGAGVATFVTLFGYGGNDTLTGGSFGDVLYGGAGNDTLTGGGGADFFVFEGVFGTDRINDYVDGADRMVMRTAGLTQFSQLLIVQSGADAFVSFGSNGTIRFVGVTASTLTASDFIFEPASAEVLDDTDTPLMEPVAEPSEPDLAGTVVTDLPDYFDFTLGDDGLAVIHDISGWSYA